MVSCTPCMKDGHCIYGSPLRFSQKLTSLALYTENVRDWNFIEQVARVKANNQMYQLDKKWLLSCYKHQLEHYCLNKYICKEYDGAELVID